MKPVRAALLAASLLSPLAAPAFAAEDGRLAVVKERGALLCSGHNGSYLGFAEVDDEGVWKGLDIALCRALSGGRAAPVAAVRPPCGMARRMAGVDRGGARAISLRGPEGDGR